MTQREAYTILQINQGATVEEIKLAYRRQVKKYHPDIYVGDKKFAEEKTKQINDAYRILTSKNESVNRSRGYTYSTASSEYADWEKMERDLYKIFTEYQKRKEEQDRQMYRNIGIFSILMYFSLLLAFSAMLVLSIRLGKIVSSILWGFLVLFIINSGIKVFKKVRKKTKKNKS